MNESMEKRPATMGAQWIAVEVDKIADIRNALTIIQLNCQQVLGNWMSKDRVKMTKTVIEQVERIDKLLPVIKFEGVK